MISGKELVIFTEEGQPSNEYEYVHTESRDET